MEAPEGGCPRRAAPAHGEGRCCVGVGRSQLGADHGDRQYPAWWAASMWIHHVEAALVRARGGHGAVAELDHAGEAVPPVRVVDAHSPGGLAGAAPSDEHVAAGVQAEASGSGALEDRGGAVHRPALHETRGIEPPGRLYVEEAGADPAVGLAACEHLANKGVGCLGREVAPVQPGDLAVGAVGAEHVVDGAQTGEFLLDRPGRDIAVHLDRHGHSHHVLEPLLSHGRDRSPIAGSRCSSCWFRWRPRPRGCGRCRP